MSRSFEQRVAELALPENAKYRASFDGITDDPEMMVRIEDYCIGFDMDKDREKVLDFLCARSFKETAGILGVSSRGLARVRTQLRERYFGRGPIYKVIAKYMLECE